MFSKMFRKSELEQISLMESAVNDGKAYDDKYLGSIGVTENWIISQAREEISSAENSAFAQYRFTTDK